MTSRDFCYWLQGYFELQGPPTAALVMNEEQVRVVRAHLSLVFKHEIDPSAGSAQHQAELNDIHNSPQKPQAQGINPNWPGYEPGIRC